MSDIALRLENLGKFYRLGQTVGYGTLRDSITNLVAAPFRRLFSTSRTRGETREAVQSSPESKRSDSIWALKDVSFVVKQGEAVAIIGSNGAGKSTLLKILSRITTPTTGYAEINGRVGSLLEVGTGFHPELTGKENIYFNGSLLGMKKDEIKRVFDQIVDFSGIGRFIDTPVKRYSSGMYVRLGFAVAAHLEPEIMIVDEVLAVGDAAFQKKCMGKMRDVTGKGRTIIFVSHNMSAVKALCPRAILLNQGSVELDGNSSTVVQHYLGTDRETPSQIIWAKGQRPGNRSFNLTSVTLKNQEGAPSSSIELSRGGVLEIEFEVIQDNAQVVFAMGLSDPEGTWIFTSQNNTDPNYYGKLMPRGRYVTTCKLPGNLLNSGLYSIMLIGFGANWVDPFRLDNVISFSAIDDGVLRGGYYGDYSGIVRPRLEWDTRRYEG